MLKFKTERNIISVKKTSEAIHLVSLVLPFYIYFIDKQKTKTIVGLKENKKIVLPMIHIDKKVFFRRSVNCENERERFIINSKTFLKTYFRTFGADLDDSVEDVIFKFIQKKYPKTQIEKKDISFNGFSNITYNDIVYVVPSIIEINVDDPNHRKQKIRKIFGY